MTRRKRMPTSLDTMIYPDGYRPGVRKESTSDRKARAIIADRCDPISTQIEIIDRKHWGEWRAKKANGKENRRSRFRYILNQDGVGSCAAEAGTNCKASLDAYQGLPEIVYNPWSVYWKTSGGSDRGSSIGENAEYIRDNGICPEEVWPRSKGWRSEPGGEAKRVAKFFRIEEFFHCENVDQVVSAMLQGYDIHAGYSGHSISFCRSLTDSTLEFMNSWGNWGDAGFGTLSHNKIYFAYGAYAYKYVIDWEAGDWSPSKDQAKLSKATSRYMAAVHAHKVEKGRPMSTLQSEDLYHELCGSC